MFQFDIIFKITMLKSRKTAILLPRQILPLKSEKTFSSISTAESKQLSTLCRVSTPTLDPSKSDGARSILLIVRSFAPVSDVYSTRFGYVKSCPNPNDTDYGRQMFRVVSIETRAGNCSAPQSSYRTALGASIRRGLITRAPS